MESVKLLKPETRQELIKYTNKSQPGLKNLSHKISDDREKVLLIGKGDLPNIQSTLNDVPNLEKILNAEYETYINLNNKITLIFKLNKKV